MESENFIEINLEDAKTGQLNRMYTRSDVQCVTGIVWKRRFMIFET